MKFLLDHEYFNLHESELVDRALIFFYQGGNIFFWANVTLHSIILQHVFMILLPTTLLSDNPSFSSLKMASSLELLKQLTVVVADTGDFEAMRKFQPQDATTNPSLILAASGMEQYKPIVDQAIAFGKEVGLRLFRILLL